MDDLISRQEAIYAVNTALFPKINTAKDAEKALRNLPPAQPEKRTEERTETHACDCVERQAAIDALIACKGKDPFNRYEKQNIGIDWGIEALEQLPSAQPQHDISKANFLCPICGAEMEVAVSEWEENDE